MKKLLKKVKIILSDMFLLLFSYVLASFFKEKKIWFDFNLLVLILWLVVACIKKFFFVDITVLANLFHQICFYEVNQFDNCKTTVRYLTLLMANDQIFKAPQSLNVLWTLTFLKFLVIKSHRKILSHNQFHINADKHLI